MFCLLLDFGAILGAAERTQRFQLESGWNAIYLDVSPSNDEVEVVFAGGLVDMVARYFVPLTPVRFIDDNTVKPWNTEGWSVWYSEQRAESFLNSLHAIQGGAAYLVHAVEQGTLEISGETEVRPVTWKADSFNLTGFSVESSGMSFAAYFAGAENRIGSRVYRLVNGSWQKVVNLSSTMIRPGEACWVFCDGNTLYQGPLEVGMGGSREIRFGRGTQAVTVDLRNVVNTPFTVVAEIEANIGLPLYRRLVNLSNATAESTPAIGVFNLGTLGPGALTHFRLELREEHFSGSGDSANLKFTTSNGVVIRVPVRYTAN